MERTGCIRCNTSTIINVFAEMKKHEACVAGANTPIWQRGSFREATTDQVGTQVWILDSEPAVCVCVCVLVRACVCLSGTYSFFFFFSPRVTLPRGDACIFYFLFFQAHTLLKLWTNLTQAGECRGEAWRSHSNPRLCHIGSIVREKWGRKIEERKVVYKGRADGKEIDLYGDRERNVCP